MLGGGGGRDRGNAGGGQMDRGYGWVSFIFFLWNRFSYGMDGINSHPALIILIIQKQNAQ